MAKRYLFNNYQRTRVLSLLTEIAQLVRGREGMPLEYIDTIEALEYILRPEQSDMQIVQIQPPIEASVEGPSADSTQPLRVYVPKLKDLRFTPKTELLAETPQAFLMVTLEELGLSSHVYETLSKNELGTVGTLFAYGLERLVKFHGFGRQGYQDLINQLAARDVFVLSPTGVHPQFIDRNRKQFTIHDGIITPDELVALRDQVPAEVLAIPLEQLQLNTRIRNCLKEIRTVGALLEVMRENLMLTDIRNLGVKSALDIHGKMKSLLQDHGLLPRS